MKPLDSATRRALRARAHHLTPVVMIGEAGLRPEVLREIDLALTHHELVKIRVLGDDREARGHMAAEICDTTGAEAVQQIGKMLVFYRPTPDEAKKSVKRRPRRKAPRRTKRSYQKA